MIQQAQPNFNQPQAGIGMTSELGSRPWQRPPQLVKVEEVVDYYVQRLSNEEVALQVGNILKMDVPVTTLANTMQIGGVMEGVHTIDTGILATPAIMEFIMLIGDSQNINYQTGVEEEGQINPEILAERAMNDLLKNKLTSEPDTMQAEEVEQPIMQEEVEEVPTGLMSRRAVV